MVGARGQPPGGRLHGPNRGRLQTVRFRSREANSRRETWFSSSFRGPKSPSRLAARSASGSPFGARRMDLELRVRPHAESGASTDVRPAAGSNEERGFGHKGRASQLAPQNRPPERHTAYVVLAAKGDWPRHQRRDTEAQKHRSPTVGRYSLDAAPSWQTH